MAKKPREWTLEDWAWFLYQPLLVKIAICRDLLEGGQPGKVIREWRVCACVVSIPASMDAAVA
jgi:hypothetical protein